MLQEFERWLRDINSPADSLLGGLMLHKLKVLYCARACTQRREHVLHGSDRNIRYRSSKKWLAACCTANKIDESRGTHPSVVVAACDTTSEFA